MDIRRVMICLLIVWILILCMPNFAVAKASKYSIAFNNKARHASDYTPMVRNSTSNGIVYVGSNDNNVYALDATTEVKVWNYTTGDWVDSSPIVSKGVVYVGSMDHNVYALNAYTGTMIWKYTAGGEVNSSPAIADSII